MSYNIKLNEPRLREKLHGAPQLSDFLVKDANQPVLRKLLAARAKSVSPWESAFVENMGHRYRMYGEDMIITDRQRNVLNRIVDRSKRNA